MTTPVSDLIPLVTQYRAGLDAEMVLLRRIAALSDEQRGFLEAGRLVAIPPLVEERDRLMASLVGIEAGLKPVRAVLADAAGHLAEVEEFQELMVLHQEAAELAGGILHADAGSLEALREAEQARRASASALEQGESTLAAYRRASAASPLPATIVNRHV
jgi:hypothetical protein